MIYINFEGNRFWTARDWKTARELNSSNHVKPPNRFLLMEHMKRYIHLHSDQFNRFLQQVTNPGLRMT